MNKLTGFISVITLCLCTQTAYAKINEPTFGENMDVHFTSNTIVNQDITFSVFQADDNGIILDKCVYQQQGKTDGNGDYSADFTLNIPSGNCIAVLSSRQHKENEELSFYYVNKKHLENTLSDINNASDADKLGIVLENAWSEIGTDVELVGKVSDKKALYTGILNGFDKEVTKDNLSDFCLLIKQQAIRVLAYEGKLTEIKSYAADMGLDKLDVWADVNSTDTEKSILEMLKGLRTQNTGDFLKKFEECAVVRLICSGDVNKTKSFVQKYKSVAGIESKINSLSDMSDRQQYNVYSSIASCSASSYDSLSDKIDTFIKNAKKTTSASSGGSGGGGYIANAGKTNTTAAPAEDTKTDTSSNAEKLPFADLDGCDWAKEAIGELYARKVVSGRDSLTFAPNDSVTREEFISMLIKALNLSDETAKCDFEDISSDRWSYGAVSSASKYGIVVGADGKFNPADKITRQDLSVMVYRALKVADTGVKTVRDYKSFNDYSDISDYAVEAVESLYKCGIINGVTETSFAPQDNATRAQSAKILYEIIRNNAD